MHQLDGSGDDGSNAYAHRSTLVRLSATKCKNFPFKLLRVRMPVGVCVCVMVSVQPHKNADIKFCLLPLHTSLIFYDGNDNKNNINCK